jgi:hypothetical protein
MTCSFLANFKRNQPQAALKFTQPIPAASKNSIGLLRSTKKKSIQADLDMTGKSLSINHHIFIEYSASSALLPIVRHQRANSTLFADR